MDEYPLRRTAARCRNSARGTAAPISRALRPRSHPVQAALDLSLDGSVTKSHCVISLAGWSRLPASFVVRHESPGWLSQFNGILVHK